MTPGHSQASLDQPLVGLLLLKQIRYNYKLEVTNRFKGLDLIDRVPEEIWMEVCDVVQETVIKTIPEKKKCLKQHGCLRSPYEQL